jgi:hypothetical protein
MTKQGYCNNQSCHLKMNDGQISDMVKLTKSIDFRELMGMLLTSERKFIQPRQVSTSNFLSTAKDLTAMLISRL